MLKFTVIGNLGSDAKVEDHNGKKFVSFNVGHNDRYTDAEGKEHVSTQWVSCALNGDGGQLLQYLTKGKTVYVEGRGSTRVYSSPKERKFVAGLNISVDRVELLAGSSESVPRRLANFDGEIFDTYKAYYVKPEVAKAEGATKNKPAMLYAADGRRFSVDYLGWVRPLVEEDSEENQNNAHND